jgi:putative membrane protein
MYWDGGWGGWIVMLLMMTVIWGAVIAGVVLVVRGFGPLRPGSSPADDAERILAERFARGEIDQDEFTRRRDALKTRV